MAGGGGEGAQRAGRYTLKIGRRVMTVNDTFELQVFSLVDRDHGSGPSCRRVTSLL
jgi:hypothetical protein